MRYIKPAFIVDKKIENLGSNVFGLRSFSSMINLYDFILFTLGFASEKTYRTFYLPSTLFADQGFDLYKAVATVLLDEGCTIDPELAPFNSDYLKRIYLSKKPFRSLITIIRGFKYKNIFSPLTGRENNAILLGPKITTISEDILNSVCA